MVELVPLLEFLHVLHVSGFRATLREVVAHPSDHWNRLPAARRASLLRRPPHLLADAAGDEDVVDIVAPRGQPPQADKLFLRVTPAQGVARLRALARVDQLLRYQPFHGDAFDSEELDAILAKRSDTRTVAQFKFIQKGPRWARRSTISYLDEAWGEDPYDVDSDEPFVRLHAEVAPNKLEEAYWVDAPFAGAAILWTPSHEHLYRTVEPVLTEYEASILEFMNTRIRDALTLDAADSHPDRALYVASTFFDLLREYRFRVERYSAYKLGYHILRNYQGFGRLEPLMRDPHIEDISCNGANLPLYVVHGRYHNVPTSLSFAELELDGYTTKLAQRGGKLLSVAQPLVDATLPEGSRIQASLGREVTGRGSTFTIRKFKEDPLTCVDLIRSGAHTAETLAFLWLAVESKCNLMVMGATASGKTTTLNVLSQFIPPASKIVSIEDTREITVQHENWLAAITRESFTGRDENRISMYDLLRAALRQRPEYIIVGEIRGIEGLTLFQAMSTGHTCFSTMHAGSVENAVHRLENSPINVPRVMLTSLDFFLLQGQVHLEGKATRRMLSLTELNGIDAASRNLRMNEIFQWQAKSDSYLTLNSSSALEKVCERRGWSFQRLEEELQARQDVLTRLVERKARHHRDVTQAIRAFYGDRAAAEHDGGRRATQPGPSSVAVRRLE